MATRARKQPADDGRAVALVPIDARGRLVEGGGSYPVPEDEDPGGEPEEEHHEQTSADRVMALLSEVADDERAVVKVFRELPNGKQAWCNDYSPSEFEQGGFKMIRRSWGEGTFFVVLYGGTPFRIKSKTKVQIDASREPEAAQASGGMSGEMAAVLRQMADGQALMLRAITDRPDPMADMTKTLAMMTAMREAMGMNAQPAQKSSIGEIVDALKELRGAQDLIGGKDDKDEPDSLMGIAKTFLPAIVAAAQGVQAQRVQAPPMPTVHVPPHIAAAPGTAAAAMDNFTGDDPMFGMNPEAIAAFKLKAFVRSLILMAGGGDETIETAAELVFEKIPDEALEILELPVWFTMFAEQFPEVVPIEAWLTKVRDRVIAMLDEDEAPEDGPWQLTEDGQVMLDAEGKPIPASSPP